MTKKQRLFPNRTGSNRSCTFEVKCGEVAMLTGFFPCEAMQMCINKIEEDKCRCIYHEKEHCQLGDPAGIDNDTCEGIIVMPGKYVAILQTDPCADLPDDDEWGLYVEVCPALHNLQTLAQVASVGAI